MNIITQHEEILIQTILDRACQNPQDRAVLEMSLIFCHRHVCKLDLERMAEWDRDYDLVHDVYGIANNLHVGSMKLLNCFSPRFELQT